MVERPRGTRDFTPEDMDKLRYVENVMRKISSSFGFREVGTPIFESAELFIMRSGPDVIDQMYVFKDKGGRELALRPELTAPVMRFFVEKLNSYPKPLKIYYMGPCFRYERPQRGRYREYLTFGAELIGGRPLWSDLEILSFATRIMRGVGIKDFTLRVGNIAILRKLLRESSDLLGCLRLISAQRYEELAASLAEDGLLDKEQIIMSLVELKGKDAIRRAREIIGQEAGEELEYLERLCTSFTELTGEDVEYDLAMVRGLDYYTGMVFEIDCDQLGAEKQVCGGGSYTLSDVLGGQHVFSTGFGFGTDRIILVLEEEGFDFPSSGVEVYVIPIGEGMRKNGMSVLSLLRENGISADIDLVGRGPSKNLDYANAIGAKKVILLGEDEWMRKAVGVKDMESGEQSDVPLEQLIEFLKK